MNILGAAVIAIGSVFLALYLRNQQKEIAVLIGICAVVVLFTAAVARASEALNGILEIAVDGSNGETAEILVKALGIASAAQITADICREAGEASVGTQVELFAKVEIILLSLPLAEQLMKLAEKLLG